MNNQVEEVVLETGVVILNAITYELQKHDDKRGLSIRKGSAWNVTGPVAQEFVSKIEKKFTNKDKLHSKLTADASERSVPTLLDNFVKKMNVPDNDGEHSAAFLSLVQELATKIMLAGWPRAATISVGNIVFLHYFKSARDQSENGSGFLLVVMLDKKGSFDFDSTTLEPTEIESIDTDALKQAALYDLTCFSSSYPSDDGETYLQFIEGKNKSSYFKDALGCENVIDNAKSLKECFNALEAFMIRKKVTLDNKDRIRAKLKDFIRSKRGSHVSLTDVDTCVRDALSLHGHKVTDGEFGLFINANGYKVSHTFTSNPFSEKAATSVDLSDPDGNYEFKVNRSSLGKNNSSKSLKVSDDMLYVMVPIPLDKRSEIGGIIGAIQHVETSENV